MDIDGERSDTQTGVEMMMRPRCPECDCVLTREGDWDDTPTGFCSYCGWPNRYDEEEE